MPSMSGRINSKALGAVVASWVILSHADISLTGESFDRPDTTQSDNLICDNGV